MTDEPKPSTQAHRDSISALPRPDLISGLDSKGISAEARRVREIDTTTRVYRKDWLFDTRHETEVEAHAFFAVKYEGRIEPEDFRIVPVPVGEGFFLEIRRWNILGEFKTEELAAELLVAQVAPEECRLVTRNSRQEHLLTDYGTKKLAGVLPKPQ